MIMNHAADGTLQAYVDGELESFERAALERHLEACSACVAELDGLRAAGARFASAVRMLDEGAGAVTIAPMPLSLRTRRAWHGPHRMLARAATIIVALGLSAALVEATTGVVSQLVDRMVLVLGVEDDAPAPLVEVSAPAGAELRSYSIEPRTGAMRLGIEGAAPGLTIRVRLTDDESFVVSLEGAGDEAEVRFGADWGTVQAGNATAIEITLPRQLAHARLDVNGVRYLTKEGADMRYAIPPADTANAHVEFQVTGR